MLGALPIWKDESDQQLALDELERDAHATSTRESNESRLRTLHRALDAWGLDPFPLATLGSSLCSHAKEGEAQVRRFLPLAV